MAEQTAMDAFALRGRYSVDDACRLYAAGIISMAEAREALGIAALEQQPTAQTDAGGDDDELTALHNLLTIWRDSNSLSSLKTIFATRHGVMDTFHEWAISGTLPTLRAVDAAIDARITASTNADAITGMVTVDGVRMTSEQYAALKDLIYEIERTVRAGDHHWHAYNKVSKVWRQLWQDAI